jgi:hypothetical protein
MGTKILAVAAIALCPAIALSQGRDTAATGKNVTTNTSTGAVSADTSAAGRSAGMNKGQDDANVIGTPAWWKTRATADGKPLGAGANAQPQRSDTSKKRKP